LLYICGHPGQGKTAVVNQVLFDYFGDLDSNLGGTYEQAYLLKYNGMRFNTPYHFVESLLADLTTILQMQRPRKTGNLLSLA
jgi:Cdc6-like AAA superfamily ATPase